MGSMVKMGLFYNFDLFASFLLILGPQENMAADVECPEGWMDASIVNYHLGCLKFVLDESHSWGDAYKYCQQREAHLVEFYSYDEIHFVMTELRAIDSTNF